MELNSVAIVSAGAVGLLTGAIAVLAFFLSERERRGRVGPPAQGDSLAAVLAVLPWAAIVVSDDGRVSRATAAAHALGLVRDGHIRHPAVQEMIDSVRVSGEILDEDLTLPLGLKGGGSADLAVRAAPLSPVGVLVLAEDNTESRRLEVMRRDLVGNVSHELKTPVGAIALLAETVRDSADDPQAVRHFAGRLEREARRLGELVQDIIEFSRLQEKDVMAAPRTVSIDDVTARAIDQVEAAAMGRGVSIHAIGDRGLYVLGDEELLTTAVRNLLDNAINYSATGSEVGLRMRATRGKVVIDIEDHGIGIAPTDAERVFERFYRADAARSRSTGGTGLGLSIVKHIAQNHGGQVKLRSEPGAGSTFSLELPRRALVPPRPGHETDETSGEER